MDSWRTARQLLYLGIICLVAILGVALCVLLIGGSQLLSVQSGSMEPAIQKGDLISVKRTPTRDLRVGDVITFAAPDGSGQTITHRIVAKTNDMTGRIVTQGDANETADQAVMPSQIVGRVERHVPYAGFLVDFIKQPLGLVLLIYIPTLLIVIHEIKYLTEQFRRTEAYRDTSVPSAS